MENEFIGKWIFKDGRVIADSTCEFIQSIIENDLTEIATGGDGWTKRYKHINGSIWELTYPESHLQGGGPPKLTRIKE
ncbi:MAG: hypothetical protein SchgKO_10440 [Schleiferiaceae bacterium]